MNCKVIRDRQGSPIEVFAENGKPSKLFHEFSKLETATRAYNMYRAATSPPIMQRLGNKALDKNGEPVIHKTSTRVQLKGDRPVNVYDTNDGDISLESIASHMESIETASTRPGTDQPEFAKLFQEKFVPFLEQLGITITNDHPLLKDLKLNTGTPTSGFDILQKYLVLGKSVTNADLAKQAANILYTFLGKKSELGLMLWKNVDKWSGYADAYNKYDKESLEQGDAEDSGFNAFAHKMAITDFMAEIIQFGIPHDFKAQHLANDDITSAYFNERGYKNPYEQNFFKRAANLIWNLINEYVLNNKIDFEKSETELRNIVLDIVNDVYEKDYKKFIRSYIKDGDKYVNIKTGEEFEEKDYQKTMDKDPFAKMIIEKLFNNPFIDYKLSGSQSLRKYGRVIRSINEDLHDIDGVITLEQFKSEANYKPFLKWIEQRGIKLSNDDQKQFQKEVEKFLNQQIWYQNVKELFPTWDLKVAFIGRDHGQGETITITGTVQNPNVIDEATGMPKEYILDFFLRTKEGNYPEVFENYWKDWKQIFEAKLRMGRLKDLNDLIYFQPFIDDKYKFTNKGFRYFTFAKDTNSSSKPAEIPVGHPAVDILNKLSTKFNISWEVDNTMSSIGEFRDGVVYINMNKVKPDTPFHEFAHPFIKLIETRRPALHANLRKQIQTSKAGQRILEKVKKNYPDKSEDDQMNEAIVTAIGELSVKLKEEMEKKDQTLWETVQLVLKRLTNYIKQLVSNPEMVAYIEDLDWNTSLQELAALMVSDNRINLKGEVRTPGELKSRWDAFAEGKQTVTRSYDSLGAAERARQYYSYFPSSKPNRSVNKYVVTFSNPLGSEVERQVDPSAIGTAVRRAKQYIQLTNNDPNASTYTITNPNSDIEVTATRASTFIESVYPYEGKEAEFDYSVFGTRIHRIIELLLQDSYDQAEMDNLVGLHTGYFQALKTKAEEIKRHARARNAEILTEVPYYNTQSADDNNRGIAGTIDILIVYPDGKAKIIDIKTVYYKDYHRRQHKRAWSPLDFDGKGFTKDHKYSLQQELYRRMVTHGMPEFNVPGLEVTDIVILPIEVSTEESAVSGRHEITDVFVLNEENVTGYKYYATAKEKANAYMPDSPDPGIFKDLDPSSLDNLSKNILGYLEDQMKYLKTRPGNKKAIAQLVRLQNILKKLLPQANGLDHMIKEAYDALKISSDSRLDDTGRRAADGGMLGVMENLIRRHKYAAPEDKAKLQEQITKLSELAKIFDVLQTIADNDVFKKIVSDTTDYSPEYTTLGKLRASLEAAQRIKTLYKSFMIPIIADTILEARSPELAEKVKEEFEGTGGRLAKAQERVETIKRRGGPLKEVRLKRAEEEVKRLQQRMKRFSPDRQSLIEALQETSVFDESDLDLFFNPLISSPQSYLALFAKTIRNARLAVEDRLRDSRKPLADAFLKFAKATGRNRNNVETFYKGLTEIVKVFHLSRDDEGKTVITWTKERRFVGEIDMNKYNEERATLEKALREAYITDAQTGVTRRAKNYYDIRNNWYLKYHEALPLEQVEAIIYEKIKEQREGIITYQELRSWADANMSYTQQVKYKIRTLEEGPAPYHTVKQDFFGPDLTQPKKSVFSNKRYQAMRSNSAMSEFYDVLVTAYTAAQARLPKHKRPGLRIPSVRKTATDKIWAGKPVNGLVDKLKDDWVPQDTDDIYGDDSQRKDVMLKTVPIYYVQEEDADLISEDLLGSILLFEKMSVNYEEMNKLLPQSKAMLELMREKKNVKGSGNTWGAGIMKQLGVLGEEADTEHGETNYAKHFELLMNVMLFGETRVKSGMDKPAAVLAHATALASFSLDTLKGVANSLTGNALLAIEAFVGDYISLKSWRQAQTAFATHAGGLVTDIGKPVPESKLGLLMELYDAMTGEFYNEYGRKVSGSAIKRSLNESLPFVIMSSGEVHLAGVSMIAMLKDTMVKDKNGKEMSLWDAYEVVNGELTLKEGVEWSDHQRHQLTNKLNAMNHRLHGIYHTMEKGTVQRHWYGTLLTLFRKFLQPGIKKRFKSVGVDEELGMITEGTYRAFFRNMILESLMTWDFNLKKHWDNMTEEERKNSMRAIYEVGLGVLLFTLFQALSALGDDDEEIKNNWFYQFTMYEIFRVRGELLFYINPVDTYRVLRSPSAATSTIERIFRLVQYAFFTYGEDRYYKRDTGPWEKGTPKWEAQLYKLFGMKGYNRHPEEALKVLQFSRL